MPIDAGLHGGGITPAQRSSVSRSAADAGVDRDAVRTVAVTLDFEFVYQKDVRSAVANAKAAAAQQ